MTPLRQRFSDDLRLRNKSPRTIEAYVHAVAKFARHYNTSPELLGPEQIRQYQLHLIDLKVSWSQFNQGVCALRFLYNVTLKRPHLVEHLPFAKRPRLLPDVLTRDEVARLLAAARPGRDRTILEVKYSGGLRLRELLGLKVGDIDSARMTLHIRRGKGQKERFVPISSRVLELLRVYWREYRPTDYLFPGLKPGLPLHDGTVQRLCKRTAKRAGLSFSYKDDADEHQQKTMTFDACEFLRRFVQHVLPRGFVKMRHYGLLANRFRQARLQASRRLLLVEVIREAIQQSSAEPVEVEPPKERCCEKCGSRRLECVPLPKSRNTS